MPIYTYRAMEREAGCKVCAECFEVRQSLSEDALSDCPWCAARVERIITPPFVQGGDSHRLKEGHIEKHGFTQYRRSAKGVYEKTAGRGPDVIADDGK
jgi:putative FmdB family regulatory protein